MKTLLLTALLAVLSVSTSAQAQAAQASDARAAKAARALQELPDIVTKDNHRALGFESAEEARAGKLGDAIPVFMIRLDALQQYRGEDPGRLLTDVQRAVYPVEVEGQVRTTVELQSVNGRWEVARMGGAQKIRAMDKQRRSTMKARSLRGSDFFEVRIPALNLSFLGHHDEDGLRLTPLADDASLKLQAGRAVLASELLTQLVPLAQATPSDMP
ncbi:hypothetical protein [Hyalangium minutum]|uniref:Lipoprotein n=1 Tax=Hyalangium minutum TaxID=394096 RepID=A0A085W7Q9_9BACT|nr:hypothetical protein [Hyalangium minutum]KFE63722.1 hypothetical protein DB31_2490 [Hyalangium minutum]